jgi:hypothetical protein
MDGIFQFKFEQAATWSTWQAKLRLFNLNGQILLEKEFQMTRTNPNELGFTWVWNDLEKQQAKGQLLYEITIKNDQNAYIRPFRGKIATLK